MICFKCLFSCAPDAETVSFENRVGSLPLIPLEPETNESTIGKVELGRLLFWDPIMSGNKDVSCATCHHPDNAYTDSIPISIGVAGHGLAEGRTPGVFAA